MITAKKLGLESIEMVKSLFFEVFTNEPWNDDWSDPAQLHEYMTDLMGNRNSLTFGLYEGYDLIGLSMGIVIHCCVGMDYCILELCIRADCQGKGLGTEFLGQIKEYCRRHKITRIFLQTERAVPAYEFYKKNGFIELNGYVSLVKEFN